MLKLEKTSKKNQMKTNQADTFNSNRRLLGILLAATLLLLIPLTLQLTIGSGVDGQGFNWKMNDFVIMGMLLFGTGLAFEFVMRKVKTIRHGILIPAAILSILLLIWAELAVGIIGTPFAGS